MNLEQYRAVFLVITLGLSLVAASPILTILVPFTDVSEEFSEIGLLGPEHTTTNYPFNVIDGEMHNIFVWLENHMGSSEFYMIYVKFGNTTQLDFDSSEPSSLPPLYEFRAFVGDEAYWESLMTFGFQNVVIDDNGVTVDNVTMNSPTEDSVLFVDDIIINGIVFPVDASTSWDSEYGGFYFRLSFELWRYNATVKDFSYHDRVIGLQLNITISE